MEVICHSKVTKVMKYFALYDVSVWQGWADQYKISMTSQYATAPHSGRLETLQNGIFEEAL